ncbi:MAG: hypothetical protein ACQETH_05850 [Candidatus Rifleibacteriota bacterium]
MERVSSSRVQQAYAREPHNPQRNEQARSYDKLDPNEQRQRSRARKPEPAVKTLGTRIDVYA